MIDVVPAGTSAVNVPSAFTFPTTSPSATIDAPTSANVPAVPVASIASVTVPETMKPALGSGTLRAFSAITRFFFAS